MTARGFELSVILLLASKAIADQVVMKNGDRVTGSIVKKDATSVTIKTVHFGLVTTMWDQVAAIHADTPLSVVLPGGNTVKGTVATSDGMLKVNDAGNTASAPLTEVETLRDEDEQRAYERLLNPRVIDLWTVNGSLGVAGATGNAKALTLVVPVTATRVTRNDKTTLYFNSIRSSALVDGQYQATARAIRGGWVYNRDLRGGLFWNLFNDYEYDRSQDLDLRVLTGSGLGFKVWEGENGQFDLVGGSAWNRESFDPTRPRLPFVRNALEGFWGDNLTLRIMEASSLTQSYRMFNNLKDVGSRDEGGFGQHLDLTVTVKLSPWLTWNAAVSDRFLQHPLADKKKNDIVYSTGFGFVIAR